MTKTLCLVFGLALSMLAGCSSADPSHEPAPSDPEPVRVEPHESKLAPKDVTCTCGCGGGTYCCSCTDGWTGCSSDPSWGCQAALAN